MRIPNEAIPVAYAISKKVYEKEFTFSEGKTALATNASMNPSSAADYINDFKCLVEGRRFTRTLNVFSMEYFLANVLKDFGPVTLSKALYALREHIEYYEAVQEPNVTLHKMRAVYAKYLAVIPGEDINEQEQNEIAQEIIKEQVSKEKLLTELKDVKESDPEQVTIKGRIFKRNNKTIAQIKILRNFACQFCGTTIKKKDGSYYIEAAHIKAKHLKGCETLDNIILLCPNHHKEFDLGERLIKYPSETSVDIIVNGKEYHIQFER